MVPEHVVAGVHIEAPLETEGNHHIALAGAPQRAHTATLQELADPSSPIIIRIESKAGHGAGKPTAKIVEEAVDMFSFILYYASKK